jgi:hypothetical protein
MVKILTIPEIEKAFGIKVFDKIEKQRNKDRYLDKDGYIYIRINGYIKLERFFSKITGNVIETIKI